MVLPGRTTVEKRTPGKARAASGTRILLKQFSLESSRRKRGRCQLTGTQHGDARYRVRAWKACRGLRAWRARKQTHETEEARRVPAALTARAKQEGRRNDKKRRLTLRESDRLIVSSGKAQAPKLEKGPTGQRSPHRQPVP